MDIGEELFEIESTPKVLPIPGAPLPMPAPVTTPAEPDLVPA